MQQRVIEYMLEQHAIGEVNAISERVAAFDLGFADERALREVIRKINEGDFTDLVIGGTSKGIFLCTEADIGKVLTIEFRASLSRLNKARKMEVKAKKNGIFQFNTETLEMEVIESLKKEVE